MKVFLLDGRFPSISVYNVKTSFPYNFQRTAPFSTLFKCMFVPKAEFLTNTKPRYAYQSQLINFRYW